MAKIKFESGQTITDLAEIAATLAPLNIQLNHWPLGDDPELAQLLAQESLTDDEKETVLVKLDHYFQQLQETEGYQNRDLIVLNPQTPQPGDPADQV